MSQYKGFGGLEFELPIHISDGMKFDGAFPGEENEDNVESPDDPQDIPEDPYTTVPESISNIYDNFSDCDKVHYFLTAELYPALKFIIDTDSNLDKFLIDNNIIPVLCKFLNQPHTPTCKVVLNLLVLIARKTQLITQISKDYWIKLLIQYTRSPDFLTPIATILLYAIDIDPDFVLSLVLNPFDETVFTTEEDQQTPVVNEQRYFIFSKIIDMASFVTSDPYLNSDVLTLIYIIFSHMTFADDSIILTFEDSHTQTIPYPNEVIFCIKNKLLDLIRVGLLFLPINGYAKSMNLVPRFKILDHYIECFINESNFGELFGPLSENEAEITLMEILQSLSHSLVPEEETQQNSIMKKAQYYYHRQHYIDLSFSLFYFFSNPTSKYDPEGIAFSYLIQVLNRILLVCPPFFERNQFGEQLNGQQFPSYLETLLLHINNYSDMLRDDDTTITEVEEGKNEVQINPEEVKCNDRKTRKVLLELLFFLSNCIKYKPLAQQILNDHLLTRYHFVENMELFDFAQKQLALLTLLTVFYYFPIEFVQKIPNHQAILDEAADISYSTTSSYYLITFVKTMLFLFDNYLELLKDVDYESLMEALQFISELENPEVSETAQILFEKINSQFESEQ